VVVSRLKKGFILDRPGPGLPLDTDLGLDQGMGQGMGMGKGMGTGLGQGMGMGLMDNLGSMDDRTCSKERRAINSVTRRLANTMIRKVDSGGIPIPENTILNLEGSYP
jgi:hypothetical protein